MKKTLLSLLSVSLILGACGKAAEEKTAEKSIEKSIENKTGGNADVDVSGEGVSIKTKTKDGGMTITSGDAAKMPEGFPKGVFIPKTAKLESAVKVPQGFSLSLVCDKDVKSLKQSYNKKMKAEGWEKMNNMEMGKNIMLTYQKKKQFANVSLMPENKKNRITLNVVKQ